MLLKIFSASALGAITVIMHAVGFALLLSYLLRSNFLTATNFWSVTRFVIMLTFCLILIHVAEIAVWGLFYFWQGCLPDLESALYFSGVTYTSVGYGDLVLPKEWRMLAPMEAMTGILMSGLSTGLFFALVSRLVNNWMKAKNAQ